MTTPNLDEIGTESADTSTESVPAPSPGEYETAVVEFLDAADWLTALDAPLKVHARSVARSLDAQLRRDGVVQSALASSFDKVMVRLYDRRPAAPAPDPLVAGVGPQGEASMFTLLEGE